MVRETITISISKENYDFFKSHKSENASGLCDEALTKRREMLIKYGGIDLVDKKN